MLAFDKGITSERTDEELKNLQEETVDLIKIIENCNDYQTNVTKLCDYCVFKSLCPAFKHEVELEGKTPEQFKEDDGVKIIDEYSELEKTRKGAQQKIEVLKERLINFANQKGLSVVYGSNKKASIKECEKVVFPDDKEELVKMLKNIGLYEEFSSVNYLKLSSRILKGEIDKSIVKLTTNEKDYKIYLSQRKEEED